MNLQVGVKILLKNDEYKYLLLQRSSKKYPEVGTQWDIPGGRIEIGISLIENLKREIFEETKLQLVGEPKLIAAQDILREDKHVVRLTYTGKAEGEIELDEDNEEYKWSTLDEMKELESLDKYIKEILNKL